MFINYYAKMLYRLWAQVSQWRQDRSNQAIYMCVAYFQGYIFAVHLLLVDLYMLLLAPLAKYKVMLHSVPCCLASN